LPRVRSVFFKLSPSLSLRQRTKIVSFLLQGSLTCPFSPNLDVYRAFLCGPSPLEIDLYMKLMKTPLSPSLVVGNGEDSLTSFCSEFCPPSPEIALRLFTFWSLLVATPFLQRFFLSYDRPFSSPSFCRFSAYKFQGKPPPAHTVFDLPFLLCSFFESFGPN